MALVLLAAADLWWAVVELPGYRFAGEPGVLVASNAKWLTDLVVAGAVLAPVRRPAARTAVILGVLGVLGLTELAALPHNIGVSPVYLTALWALYRLARDPGAARECVAAFSLAAGAGSLLSPVMTPVVDVGERAYLRGLGDIAAYLLLHWALIGVAVLAGRLRRTRELEEDRRRRADAARAVERERVIIAAEIHDVLAHTLTLIRMQAAAGRYAPETARDALETIHRVAGEGVAEVRDIIAVLRDGTGQPGESTAAWVPGEGSAVAANVSGLDEVCQRFREAGLVVDVSADPALAGLAPVTRLALRRVLTEALTNALKHQGPGTRASVRGELGRKVSLEVITTAKTDRRPRPEGAGAPADSANPASSPDPAGGTDATGCGFGLVELAERARSLGGSFTASGDSSRFVVRLELPVERPA